MQRKKYIPCCLLIFLTLSTDTKIPPYKANLLLKHLGVIRELKTLFHRPPRPKRPDPNTLTPTEAHLHVYGFEHHLSWLPNFSSDTPTIKQLVKTMVAQEYKWIATHEVFYHAQDKKFCVLQDFIKELFELLYAYRQLNDFAFLRFWQDAPATIDANIFIDQEEGDDHFVWWNNNEARLVKLLLSVNLSLFGNLTLIHGWECSFDYFLNNRSVIPIDISTHLERLFEQFDFNKRYIKQLLKLQDLLCTEEGSLFRFSSPKK